MLAAAIVSSLLALGRVPGDRTAARRACAPASSPAPRTSSSTSPRTSTPSAITSAARDDAPVTLVEYGDYECPYCGRAEVVIRELLDAFGDDLRYVWRHLPLNDVHPNAQMAAEAAEAAGAQGAFWEMHDRLLDHQDELTRGRPAPPRRGARARRRPLLGRPAPPRVRAARGRATWRAPTRAASPARRRSSSTAGATRAPTTRRSSPTKCSGRGTACA